MLVHDEDESAHQTFRVFVPAELTEMGAIRAAALSEVSKKLTAYAASLDSERQRQVGH